MTEIVDSLFGVSPERYRQQQDVALQREALAYAQLNPMQRAEAGIYAGARQLGSGIGRMLGGEDPGMRRVTEQDQIIRSIDLNDPETFGPAAQRASQMGHTELAMKILQASDAAFQRRESQNMDEAFRVYGGVPARAAAPTPAPVAMAPAPVQPIAKIGDPYLRRSIIQNPERREDQVPAGQMEQKFVTQADLDLIKNYTGPQVQLPSDLTAPSAAPAPVASAMAPQAPPSVAPAIGLEGKLEKLISDRRIFASQRPTKPGDVNRVNNTIKGIDEEIKRLTELNSPLAKVIADRDKLPPGDPRRIPFDDFIEKETQLVDRTITIGNRVLDSKTMKVLYTAPDAPPAAIAEWTAFVALPKNQQESFLKLQAAKRPSTTINMPNEGERKAATLANRLNFSVEQINQAIGVDPTAGMPNTSVEIARFLSRSEMIPNQMTSAQRQIVESAQLDILDAALTLGTGAAYTQGQLEGYRKSYFPQIGDKPENVIAKRARLQNILRSAEIASGRARVPTPIPDSGSNLSSIITAPATK